MSNGNDLVYIQIIKTFVYWIKRNVWKVFPVQTSDVLQQNKTYFSVYYGSPPRFNSPGKDKKRLFLNFKFKQIEKMLTIAVCWCHG